MPDTTLYVTHTPGSLPSGYCWPAAPQTFYNDIISLLTSYLSGPFNPFVMGSKKPDAAYNNYPWIKTDAANNFVGVYTFGAAGLWIRPHATPPSGSERRLWVGTTADLITYDGGENVAVTDTAGPFWEVDTDFAAKFLVGPGTFAGGTVVAAGGTGGADENTLSAVNMPEHQHNIGVEAVPGIGIPSQLGALYTNGGDEVFWNTTDATTTAGQTNMAGEATPTAISNLPPYRGIWVIKRSARIYFRG
jgi:hypothetical protein